MSRLIFLGVVSLIVVGCGDNTVNSRPDARIDGPRPIDARVDARVDAAVVDAGVDAVVSTVQVTAGACAGTPDHTMTTSGSTFVFDGNTGTPNPDVTINAGDTIEFSTTGSHNFESVSSSGAFSFRSGTPGSHTACLTFTAAGGPFGYQCQVHAGTMNGDITVQ